MHRLFLWMATVMPEGRVPMINGKPLYRCTYKELRAHYRPAKRRNAARTRETYLFWTAVALELDIRKHRKKT